MGSEETNMTDPTEAGAGVVTEAWEMLTTARAVMNAVKAGRRVQYAVAGVWADPMNKTPSFKAISECISEGCRYRAAMTPTEGQTNNPSGAAEHCACDPSGPTYCARDAQGRPPCKQREEGAAVDVLAALDEEIRSLESGMKSSSHLRQTRTAVAALIARNAELESEQTNAQATGTLYSLIVSNLRSRKKQLIAERDALAAENKALRAALKEIAEHPRDLTGAPDMVAIAANALAISAHTSAAAGGDGNG